MLKKRIVRVGVLLAAGAAVVFAAAPGGEGAVQALDNWVKRHQ
ncbi:MAG: hypothetical protein QOF76_4680 [Solirubrobacteraceae bacterium]|jgi:hypothetical protein|nr:hypothetical protein [Solirubrobacteraceae bacterium]